MYQCDNYEDNGKCRYYEALYGTGEDLPSGCSVSGDCEVKDNIIDSWIEVEPEDCDMLDLDDVDDY